MNTIGLPLSFTTERPLAPPVTGLQAWVLGEGHEPGDDVPELLRRSVGVRVGGRGSLVVERMVDGADIVGHFVAEDARPIPRFDHGPAPADLTAFLLGGVASGYIVLAGEATQRLRASDPWFRRWLPALVGALCVPFAMVPTPAFASASAPRRGKAAASSEAPTEPPPDAAATPAPADATAPAAAPAPAAPAPLPDSAWNAVVGKKIAITKSDGFGIQGTLVAVDPQNVSVAAEDGSIVVVPRASVATVKLVDAPSPPPPAAAPVAAEDDDDDDDDEVSDEVARTYRGLIISGSILVAIGGSMAIAGAVLTGYYGANCSTLTTSGGGATTCTGISHPGLYAGVLLVPGLLMTAGGGAMLGIGLKRKRAAERKKAEVRVLPQLRRNAWGGGIQVRF